MTVTARFLETAERFAASPAIRSRDDAVDWTWAEYADRARAAARAWHALGLRHGDPLAIWLTNRPEMHVCDAGAMLVGGAAFSVYSTYTAEQAEPVLANAGARILVTEPRFLEAALAVRDAASTSVEHVVLVEGSADGCLTLEEALAGGDASLDVDALAREVEPDDLLTLIYTSGTTGTPKGVELTHRNVVVESDALASRLQFPDEGRVLSWLPMAHIAERMCSQYFPMSHGFSVTCVPDPTTVAAALAEVHPNFFFSPPRLYEKLRAALVGKVPAEGEVPGEVAAQLRAAIGLDQTDVVIVGAAPCPPQVLEFFHRIGVPLNELYGMSECTGVATVAAPADVRAGAVGPALEGCEVRLGEADEVLIRGPMVMRGYRGEPEKTADAIDADGWLHSGDVGTFDEDGQLRIVDRIKELIIGAGGKNMSPANIEATLKGASPLIGQICVVGDGRPYNVALVVPEPDAAAAHEGDVETAIGEAIEKGNARLSRVEQVKRWAVLDTEWLPGGDELTPTMKLKRRPILEKYEEEVEALYA